MIKLLTFLKSSSFLKLEQGWEGTFAHKLERSQFMKKIYEAPSLVDLSNMTRNCNAGQCCNGQP